MQLVVTASGAQESWSRSFAGCRFASQQWKHADGLLAEQIGVLVQRFRLSAVDGSLCYQNDGTALSLWRVTLPLPHWLAPRVTASEIPDGDHIAVAVETSLPLLGLIVAYEGTLTIEESGPC